MAAVLKFILLFLVVLFLITVVRIANGTLDSPCRTDAGNDDPFDSSCPQGGIDLLAKTRLPQVVVPPLDLGMTWSRFPSPGFRSRPVY